MYTTHTVPVVVVVVVVRVGLAVEGEDLQQTINNNNYKQKHTEFMIAYFPFP